MLPINIAIAGIGNVGQEVLKQLLNSKEFKDKFIIAGVSFKNKKKKRNMLKNIKKRLVFAEN